MEKVLVVLFPEEEYFGTAKDCIPQFNECIKRRYIDENYKIKVVNYKNSKGFVTFDNAERIEAGLTFHESSPYFTDKVKTPDFREIAQNLDIKNCDLIRVCGFHCFDCVAKLAKQIFELNKNIVIDTDLTEMFPSRTRLGKFDIEKFNPDFKVELMFDVEGDNPSPSTLEIIKEKYSHPIWGVSKSLLDKVDTLLNSHTEQDS